MVYRSQERWDDAAKNFEQAIKLEPKHTAGYFNLSMTYLEAGKKRKALDRFKSYLARSGSDSDALRKQTAERYVRKLEGELARRK